MVCLLGTGRLLEIFVGDLDVRVLAVLERPDHFVREDLAVVDRAPALLLEAALALFVQRVEGEVLTFGGPEELDGDGDHPESNGAFPDRSGHTGPASLALRPRHGRVCRSGIAQGSNTRRKPTTISHATEPIAISGMKHAAAL